MKLAELLRLIKQLEPGGIEGAGSPAAVRDPSTQRTALGVLLGLLGGVGGGPAGAAAGGALGAVEAQPRTEASYKGVPLQSSDSGIVRPDRKAFTSLKDTFQHDPLAQAAGYINQDDALAKGALRYVTSEPSQVNSLAMRKKHLKTLKDLLPEVTGKVKSAPYVLDIETPGGSSSKTFRTLGDLMRFLDELK